MVCAGIVVELRLGCAVFLLGFYTTIIHHTQTALYLSSQSPRMPDVAQNPTKLSTSGINLILFEISFQ